MCNMDIYNDELVQEKYNKMNELFPQLKFCVDVDDYDRLDNVLVKNKDAIIFYKHNCFCCDPKRNVSEVIYIKRNHQITYRDFYNECNMKWKNEMCNHRFLEQIDIKNDTQIDLFFGS